MYFMVVAPILMLCVYSGLSDKGKGVFTFLVWLIATIIYAVLVWIWLVVLDGFLWVQWIFGVAIAASILPAICVVIGQLILRRANKRASGEDSKD